MIEFQNQTSFVSKLIRVGDNRPDGMFAAVIARPSFRIEEKQLVPIDEVLWQVDSAPFDTPFGKVSGDTAYMNGGVDLLVFGNAIPPNREPTTELEVKISAGSSFSRTVRVIGDRFWEQKDGQLNMSEPEPFEAMPLDQSRAFGGVGVQDETPVPWHLNPSGRGFYLDEDSAKDQPLPNLEDPDVPIQAFDDRPDPYCLGIYQGALRPLTSVELDLSDINTPSVKKVKPTLFNLAHPKFVIPAADAPQAGETISIENVCESGPLEFELPTLSLEVAIQLGQRRFAFPLHVDQIGVFCEQRKVFLSYRVCFRYRTVVGEKRFATLRSASSPSVTELGLGVQAIGSSDEANHE